jgi:hypothetical protein
LTSATGVDIIDTGKVQDFLGNHGGNTSSSSWSWDHSNGTRTALSLNLDWDGMDSTDSGTPVTSSDWDEVELGINEGTLDGNLDFLGALDTNTNMTLSVTDSDNSLESSSLTSLGLLLHGQDAHDFIGKLGFVVSEESINDWGFLDWDGVSVNFFQGFDVSVFDESSKLGKWSPFFLWSSSTTTWSSSSTSTASSAEASSSIATSIATSAASAASTFSWGSLSWSWSCCWCL